MFITFEGPDGSGKTTALEGLKKYLKKHHKSLPYIFTREPGGSITAEAIRKVILDKNNTDMDSEVEALLYAGSRRQHLVSTIWPALKENKIVFCDRYIDSSLAYQGYARGLGIEHVKHINVLATNNTWPDLTFYFDIPVEIAQQRVDDRSNKDRLENENNNFRKKVHKGYEYVVKEYKNRIIVIDATQSKEEVLNHVIKVIESKCCNK